MIPFMYGNSWTDIFKHLDIYTTIKHLQRIRQQSYLAVVKPNESTRLSKVRIRYIHFPNRKYIFQYLSRLFGRHCHLGIGQNICVVTFFSEHLCFHWSRGYRRRLMFERSWVRIPASDGYFSDIFVVKIVLFV